MLDQPTLFAAGGSPPSNTHQIDPPLIQVQTEPERVTSSNERQIEPRARSVRRLCDGCRNFPSHWPESPIEYPRQLRREPDWKYQQRLREFGETLDLCSEQVCLAGIRMAFRMPIGHPNTDTTWGFFKDNCRSFVSLADLQGPPDARSRWEVAHA